MEFAADRAIVTGAARGIGRGIAERLMADGLSVAVADVDAEGAEEASAELEAEHGGRALPVECDVTDADAVEAAVETAADELGPVGLLVNNAGGARGGLTRTWETSEEDWDATVDVTLKGTFLCTRAIVGHMIEGGVDRGAVVNVSSLNFEHPTDGLGAYSAAKAGVSNFTKTVAGEAGRFGIRVNAVAPGSTRTPALEAGGGLEGDHGEAFLDRTVLERRFGEPADVAAVVAFLASEGAGWITGETIRVDGGQHIRGLHSYWDAVHGEGAFEE